MWSVCGCVSLNLSPLHTPQPCARVSTRAEAESTGVRELEAGPHVGGAQRGRDGRSNRKRFPLLLLDFKLNICLPMNDAKNADIQKIILYCMGMWIQDI